MVTNKFRTIIHCLDASSGHIAKVPLSYDDNPPYAIIDEETYRELENLGCSFVWHIDKTTGRVNAWGGTETPRTFIDRLVAGCKERRGIICIDQNPLNLRRANLCEVHSSVAKHDARDPNRIPRPKRIMCIMQHHWDY